jgi:hypothetical protein
MSTPPEQPGTTTTTTTAPGGGRPGGYGYLQGSTDFARLPIPGNAEFLVYLVASILLWLVCWFSDSLGAGEWVTMFTAITFAYLISRGIAKASRVLEQ